MYINKPPLPEDRGGEVRPSLYTLSVFASKLVHSLPNESRYPPSPRLRKDIVGQFEMTEGFLASFVGRIGGAVLYRYNLIQSKHGGISTKTTKSRFTRRKCGHNG